MEYLPRKIEKKLECWIDSPHVITIKGARQSGKTTLLKHLHQKYGGNYISLEFDDHADAIVKDPVLFAKPFIKDRFLYLDEAQYVKDIGKYIKLIFDHYGEKLKIFITGSGSFEIKENVGKYLVGRTIYFELYPLCFEEFLLWRDKSLYETYHHYKKYFENLIKTDSNQIESVNLPLIYTKQFQILFEEFITYGGYPAVVREKNYENKRVLLTNLVHTYIERDVFYFLKVREIEKFKRLLKTLSIMIGSMYESSNLSNELKIDFKTLQNYVKLLDESYIIDLVRPYFSNIINELKKMPKIYFLDTGLRNAILGNFLPLNRRTDSGALLESHVFSELRKAGYEPKYWRKTTGAEVDFILDTSQAIIPIEIKKSANLRRSFLSFINHYKPTLAALLKLELDKIETMSLGESMVFVYPLYLI